MFYLTTHSTHFYLWLHGIGHMTKDHSDSERRNPLPPLHGLLFSISSRIKHITAFVTPVVEHWLEREIATCLETIFKDNQLKLLLAMPAPPLND